MKAARRLAYTHRHERASSLGSQHAEQPDFAEHLRKLKALHDEGILTDDEYAREKREVLERT